MSQYINKVDTLFQTSRPFLHSRSSPIPPQAQTSPCTTKRVASHTSLRHIFNTSLTSSTVRYHSYTPEDIAGGYGRMPLIRNGEQRTRLNGKTMSPTKPDLQLATTRLRSYRQVKRSTKQPLQAVNTAAAMASRKPSLWHNWRQTHPRMRRAAEPYKY